MDIDKRQATLTERWKENMKMTLLSAVALAVMVFVRITFWDGRPTIEHILIIAMIVLLSFFQLYLIWERHWIMEREKENAEHQNH